MTLQVSLLLQNGVGFYFFERGLNLTDKSNYGLVDTLTGLLFLDEDKISTMTFQEFRQLLTGNTPANPSNMQLIASWLASLKSEIQTVSDDTTGIIQDELDNFKNTLSDLIRNDDDSITIGDSSAGSYPINFDDGTYISQLKNGIFSVGGIEVDNIRLKDYVLKYNNNNKHLQLPYKPETGGDS